MNPHLSRGQKVLSEGTKGMLTPKRTRCLRIHSLSFQPGIVLADACAGLRTPGFREAMRSLLPLLSLSLPISPLLQIVQVIQVGFDRGSFVAFQLPSPRCLSTGSSRSKSRRAAEYSKQQHHPRFLGAQRPRQESRTGTVLAGIGRCHSRGTASSKTSSVPQSNFSSITYERCFIESTSGSH